MFYFSPKFYKCILSLTSHSHLTEPSRCTESPGVINNFTAVIIKLNKIQLEWRWFNFPGTSYPAVFLCVVVGLKRLRLTLSKLNVSDVWSPAATIVGIMHLKWERWERRSLSVVTRVYTPTLKSRAFRFRGKSAHNTVSPERLSWLFWAQKQSAFISTQQKLKRLSLSSKTSLFPVWLSLP